MAKLRIKIREMDKNDVDSVEKLEIASYGEHHWSKDSFLGELTNDYAHYFVAVNNENNNIIGYYGLWHILEEVHILNISVSPDYRRRSVGEALLVHAINYCLENEVKYITLEVRVSNIPAKNLYEKYGLKSLGIRKGYYQDNNEDADIMWSENIFYEKFQNLYKSNVCKLNEKIEILGNEKTSI